MNDPAIELEIWHALLAVAIFFITFGVPLWGKWNTTMAKARAEGAAEQRDRDEIDGKFSTGNRRFDEMEKRFESVERSIEKLHEDHETLCGRLEEISRHIKSRNGAEKKAIEKMETILDILTSNKKEGRGQ